MKKFTNIIGILSMMLFMNTASRAQSEGVTGIAKRENKVAVLPILFISDGNTERIEEMRYRLQNIAYLYLKNEAMELKFQSPAETNALLIKKGVNESNFREFTPKELADILQVEYVLTGMVTQEFIGESSTSISNRREHRNRDWDRDWDRDRNRNRVVKTERSRTTQQLNTHIDLDIYNDKGEQIFSKSRRSILSDVDAYKNGIQYLLKRSPLYKR